MPLAPPLRTPAMYRALLALAAALLATISTPATPAAAQETTGSIAGTVAAAGATPHPLAGARITIAGSRRAAITDDHGRYHIAALTPGDYLLTVMLVGREPARRAVRVRAGTTTAADFALAEGSVLLPGVVVSAARVPQPAREVAATVSVMAREQIATSPARTTDDLLREMPGVELPRTSSTVSGPEQIVSIRGADEGRTLVLLDGVPLNDPWGEWIQWNRASRFQLDRVEVLEGGASSLYGNYAMGGVISLFSRPIAERGYALMASGGSRGAGDFSLYGSDTRGPLALSLSADYGTGGGYTLLSPDQRGPIDEDSKSTRANVGARAEYSLGLASHLFATVNYFHDDRSLGTPLTRPNNRNIVSGAVGGTFGSVLGGVLQANVYGQDQRYRSRSSAVNATRTAETPIVAQLIPSHDLGGSVQWSRQAGIFEVISVGGDIRHMVGRLDEDVYGADGTVAGTRTSGGTQQVGGAFVQGVLAPIAQLRVEASMRVDAWRSYDGSRVDNSTPTPSSVSYPSKSNSAFAPRIGVRYALRPSLTIRGSSYRGFRAPTLSEEYRTFYSGPNTFMGNPSLAPEHLTGYDAGIDWRPIPAVELRATAFWNRYRDLDDFTFKEPGPTPGSVILQRQNVGEAKSKGAEAQLALRILEPLTLTGSYDYDDARVTSTGKFVNRVPLQHGSARLSYSSRAVGTIDAVYRYEGPNHTLSGVRLAPFAVVDVHARREVLPGTILFVSVENVLDRTYAVNFAGPLEYIGLPRTVRAGISVQSF